MIDPDAPYAAAFQALGWNWAKYIVALAALFGIITVLMVRKSLSNYAAVFCMLIEFWNLGDLLIVVLLWAVLNLLKPSSKTVVSKPEVGLSCSGLHIV